MELPNIKWIISVMFLSTTNRYSFTCVTNPILTYRRSSNKVNIYTRYYICSYFIPCVFLYTMSTYMSDALRFILATLP